MPKFVIGALALALFALPAPASAQDGADGTVAAASEHFVETADGVSLYYRVVGTGEETVIVPFALFHQGVFDPLAEGRRIVTYDPRGRGRSGAVAPDRVSLDLLLEDLDTVRRAVGAERVAIIGWSGAGQETFAYALRNPGRVTRLVQLAPVAPAFEPYGAMMMEDRQRRIDMEALRALRERRDAGAFDEDPAAYCRAESAIARPAQFADPARVAATPDTCRFENEYPARLGPYFGALFQSIQGFDWREHLDEVAVPRLVIHGAEDNIPLAGNREWVAGATDARLMVIDHAGHWPHYEQTETVLRAIARFLDGGWPPGAETLPAQASPES